MQALSGGEFRPLFAKPTEKSQVVTAFKLDRMAVTNAQFALFISAHPQWSPEKIPGIFADENYLGHWQRNALGLIAPLAEDLNAPVTHVSWFAARAYCKSRSARLPSTAEWEWAAMADETRADARRDPLYQRQILDWYGHTTPNHLPDVGLSPANIHGLQDLHGLIWEWTGDFNSVLSTGESRGDSATDNQFFCGGGAVGSANPDEYASFMRYALRASLSARYTLNNLGFRCAGEP